ncbi:glycosyltransferase family 39 protein [Micromonospora citrea]|uniref:glycosyltransferase family 39 protein n=1 Tax=Micromonospora citrea TaxID=47855 RepID=UPI001FE1E540|nr:glycosyltransferase family 39 protein [Micromonospora citrea]
MPVWPWPALLTLSVTGTGIGRAQPWRDELATWSAATRPVDDLLRLAGTIDAATGPYYLLMHGWVALAGDSVTALRLPAALAMAAAAGLTAFLGQRLVDARAGLLAGLLLAVLPGTSRYGQEARPYALATLFAVLATLLLVEALRRPGWARWAGYAAAVAALGLTHLMALTLLAAHAVAVLADHRGREGTYHRRRERRDHRGRERRDHRGRERTEPPTGSGGPVRAARSWRRPLSWVLALVPAALLVTPLVLLAARQRSRQLDWVDPARLDDLAALPGGVAQSGVVGGLLVGLAALGAAGLGRRALLPGCAVLLPVLLVFAAAAVVPLWVPRYLVFVVPFACLLAGAALATVRLPAALAVVALAGLLGLPEQAALRRTHEWPRSAPVDYRGVARIVGDGQRPGDAVVYSPRESWLFLDLGLAYHLDHRPRDVLATRDQVSRGDLWAAECDRPAACLAGTDRIWLVVAGRREDPLAAVPGAKGDALRAGYTVDRVWHRPGLTVALLTR